jgi:hypothetical protein
MNMKRWALQLKYAGFYGLIMHYYKLEPEYMETILFQKSLVLEIFLETGLVSKDSLSRP